MVHKGECLPLANSLAAHARQGEGVPRSVTGRPLEGPGGSSKAIQKKPVLRILLKRPGSSDACWQPCGQHAVPFVRRRAEVPVECNSYALFTGGIVSAAEPEKSEICVVFQRDPGATASDGAESGRDVPLVQASVPHHQ